VADDLQDLASWARMKDSIVAFAVSGVSAFLPAFNTGGISCTPGSGLQVLLGTVGSANSCRIMLPQRSDDGTWTSVNNHSGGLAQAAYYNPPMGGLPQTLAAAPTAHAPYRTDLIAVQFLATQVDPHTVNVRSGTLVTPQTCYAIEDTLQFTYVPGTPSTTFPGATPAVPSGYSALYTVYVQHGDSSVGPEDILLVMPTYDQLIGAMGNITLVSQPFPCPNVGDTFTVPTNNGPTIDSGYYYILGPHDQHGVIAVQVSGEGTNLLTMTCLAVLFGTVGTDLAAGAMVNSIVQPLLYMQDGAPIIHTMVDWSGVAEDPGPGPSTVAVTFPVAFQDPTNYRITGLTPIGAGFSPFVTNKLSTGFTINIPSGSGHGNIDWGIKGHFNP
jgi:hypothetical protein